MFVCLLACLFVDVLVCIFLFVWLFACFVVGVLLVLHKLFNVGLCRGPRNPGTFLEAPLGATKNGFGKRRFG